jgi:hypothetical protein
MTDLRSGSQYETGGAGAKKSARRTTEGRSMWRRIAMVAAAALAGACGAKELDIGDPPGGAGGPTGPDPSHSTVLVSHQREAYELFSEGPYLYWGGSAQFWRCDKRDCAGTRQSVANGMGSLLIRNETMYIRYQDGIASCPADGCVSLTTIVTTSSGRPTFVDDDHVYWGSFMEDALFSCPLTGCASAETTVTTGIGSLIAFEFGGNRTHLYWASVDATGANRQSIFSAPKDGSNALPQTIVAGVLQPAAFIVDEEFVYWSSGRENATLARCSASGCPDSGPEILATGQVFPNYLAVSGGVLFWTVESDPVANQKAISRPIKILACVAAHCGETIEVLDEARGGAPIGLVSPRRMVVDNEAVYWLGDIADISDNTGSENLITESSIRRLPRKPGK